jgi:hypothetical protein
MTDCDGSASSRCTRVAGSVGVVSSVRPWRRSFETSRVELATAERVDPLPRSELVGDLARIVGDNEQCRGDSNPILKSVMDGYR